MRIRPPVVRDMQQSLWDQMTASPDRPRPPVPAAQEGQPDMDRRLARLKVLGELKTSGVLTDEEFQREKMKILEEG